MTDLQTTKADRGAGNPGADGNGDADGNTAGVDGGEVDLELPPGTHVGRYIVVSAIGGGGAGLVFAAFDPELDRKVAIKLLRGGVAGSLSSSQGQARLLREAQAMARLNHPHVVPVYDVGVLDLRSGVSSEGQGMVYIVMEFVDGGTLRHAVDRLERRGWRDVLPLFVLAGRGLAAAHAAGLVHRDFKPDNVLVGEDGRVRVTDFGLVRAAGEREHPATDERAASAGSDPVPVDGKLIPSQSDPLHTPLTQANAVMGTPGYMAPEQYVARPTDARTNQFSFCVSVYEGLYGERPFLGRTMGELSTAALAGKIADAPRRAQVPPWLRRVVLRGLSPRPDDRWPSMEALLAALQDDPAQRRRKRLAVAGALLVLVTGGVGVRALLQRQGRLCRGASDKLAEVWSDGRKAAIERAFLAAAPTTAGPLFRSVTAALDDYTARWSAARKDACEATRLRGEQPENVMALRVVCLDGRLRALASFAASLEGADSAMVERSLEATQGLPSLTGCNDVAALTAVVPPPSDARAAAEVTAQRSRLAEARGLNVAKRSKPAMAIVEAVLPKARRLGYAPLLAETLYVRGAALVDLGEIHKGEQAFEESFETALLAHDDRLAVQAANRLIQVTGYWLVQRKQAHHWERLSDALIGRLGGDDLLRVELLRQQVGTLGQEGDGKRAVALAEQALAIGKRTYREGSVQMAKLHDVLGGAYYIDQQWEKARRAQRECIALLSRLVPPLHPLFNSCVTDMGNIAYAVGDWSEAARWYKEALAISEHNSGPNHPDTAVSLLNLADALRELGDPKGALARHERSLAIYDKMFGLAYADSAWPLAGLGETHMAMKQPLQAIPPLERALKNIVGQKMDPKLTARIKMLLGEALWDTHRDPVRARKLVAEARDDWDKSDVSKERDRARAWLDAHR